MPATDHLPPAEALIELPAQIDGLSGVISGQLQLSHAAPRAGLIREHLMARVRDSKARHHAFRTRRREDHVYEAIAAGTGRAVLSAEGAFRRSVVRLEPGTPFAVQMDAIAHEVVCVSGSIVGSATAAATAPVYAFADVLTAPVHGGPAGATLYVRELMDLAMAPPLERAWWLEAPTHRPPEWVNLSEGVDIKPLRCHGHVASMLARVQPGAAVMDHVHRIDEDCMMLQGDVFLGDILLRAGDYQLAPTTHDHAGNLSDGGAVFFFHGYLEA